jgi:hypothetical protein
MIRKNTSILVVAMVGVTIVKTLLYRRKTYVAIIISLCLGLLVQSFTISGIYSKYIPDDSKGMPAILWVAMGLSDVALGTDERAGYAGWYNGINVDFYRLSDFVPEAASEEAKAYIGDFFQYSKDNPKYCIGFFIRKISSQWIAPMYQSLALNSNIVNEQPRIIEFIYREESAWKLMDVCMNLYQYMLYLSAFCFALFSWKRKRDLKYYTGLIMVFGGFLFTVIWEAKTRYTLPYLAMLIPYSAIGFNMLVNNISLCRDRKHAKILVGGNT